MRGSAGGSAEGGVQSDDLKTACFNSSLITLHSALPPALPLILPPAFKLTCHVDLGARRARISRPKKASRERRPAARGLLKSDAAACRGAARAPRALRTGPVKPLILNPGERPFREEAVSARRFPGLPCFLTQLGGRVPECPPLAPQAVAASECRVAPGTHLRRRVCFEEVLNAE